MPNSPIREQSRPKQPLIGINDTFCHHLVTEQADSLPSPQHLLQQITQLQGQLQAALARQNKLKITNLQLTNMLVSSNRAADKRNQQFVKRVELLVSARLRITEPQLSKSKPKDSQQWIKTQQTRRMQRVQKRQHHGNTFSNFGTMSTTNNSNYGSFQQQNNSFVINNKHNNTYNNHTQNNWNNKLSKSDLRKNMESLKRIERKLA